MNTENDIQHQLLLLRMEYEYEKEEFKRQTEIMGIDRKVKRGLCWYPVKATKSYYNSLNQFVVEVERHEEEKEIEHAFEFGKPVCFFTQNPDGTIRYFNYTAKVSYADENRMAIILPASNLLAELHTESRLGVQLYFDETSYRTMFEALSDVLRAKGNRLAGLRDTLLGPLEPRTRDIPSIRFPWLNQSQEQAVNNVVRAKDVAIVHGPPGTGKTTTLVEAIYETLHREHQVLVCAQSNMAVDWISEKLMDRGVPVLRIGNPSRVNDKMLSFTYERQFQSHPDYPELWSIRKAIRERKNDRHKDTLKGRATELEICINESLFAQARVIASTLVSSNHHILAGKNFPTLFIDEAAQALEAACWVAIRKADRVVFAGDYQQLPPTIKCYEAARQGLGITLPEKIARKNPKTVSLLQVQYRMNETIMGFSSEWFYDGKLKAAPEVKNRSILDLDTPMVWIDTAGRDFNEEFISQSAGRINTREADFLLETLQAYISKIGEGRTLSENIDFGLISPYKAQVQYLRRKIKTLDFFRPFRRSITVHTVDGFQGQERDVIFISLVRANDEGNIGFLNDLRRMNVAITRARMKLVILGDVSTLAKHRFYRRLYEYITESSPARPMC